MQQSDQMIVDKNCQKIIAYCCLLGVLNLMMMMIAAATILFRYRSFNIAVATGDHPCRPAVPTDGVR